MRGYLLPVTGAEPPAETTLLGAAVSPCDAPMCGSVAPGRLQTLPIDNPFGLGGVAGTVAWGLVYTGVALHWASLVAALVCVVLRFRASRGTERQQMRWVGAGAVAAVIGLLLSFPGLLGWLPDATSYILFVGLLCPPVGAAVAVAVLRLPAVGPGPAGQPHRHLHAGHRPAGCALSADCPRRQPPGPRFRQPGRGRRHPDRRGCHGGRWPARAAGHDRRRRRLPAAARLRARSCPRPTLLRRRRCGQLRCRADPRTGWARRVGHRGGTAPPAGPPRRQERHARRDRAAREASLTSDSPCRASEAIGKRYGCCWPPAKAW